MNKNYYTPEQRKEYNKKYYVEKKDKIMQLQSKTDQCELCGRTVRHQYMSSHQKSKICLKNRDKCFIMDLISMKKEIENLKANIMNHDNLLREKPREDNKEKQ